MGDADNERVETTFHMDFVIAEHCGGVKAIKDTYKRAFNGWKGSYKYFTELVMVLNHRCWMWNEKNNTLMELYRDLYYKARDYALDNFKGEALKFYLEVTD